MQIISVKKEGITVFLDCLLDASAMPVYNGKPEEVRDYVLNNQPFPDDYRVYEGYANKLMTVSEYLAKDAS